MHFYHMGILILIPINSLLRVSFTYSLASDCYLCLLILVILARIRQSFHCCFDLHPLIIDVGNFYTLKDVLMLFPIFNFSADI